MELSDGGDDFASTSASARIPSTKFTWPKDTDKPTDKLPPGGFVLTPAEGALWRKWIALYQEHAVARGSISASSTTSASTSPKPTSSPPAASCTMPSTPNRWNGPIALRGLGKGEYRLTNSFTGEPLGSATAAHNSINAKFDKFLLVEAAPAGATA